MNRTQSYDNWFIYSLGSCSFQSVENCTCTPNQKISVWILYLCQSLVNELKRVVQEGPSSLPLFSHFSLSSPTAPFITVPQVWCLTLCAHTGEGLAAHHIRLKKALKHTYMYEKHFHGHWPLSFKIHQKNSRLWSWWLNCRTVCCWKRDCLSFNCSR